MTQMQDTGPMQVLHALEARCREFAKPLPRQIEVKESWPGIGFRLGNRRLVAPLDHVVEILTYPGMSKVPGAKDWVRGIANVRGNLLPIMDLQGYLKGEAVVPSRRSRVLVVNHQGVFSGLVVDEVLGLKHFTPEQRTDVPASADAALAPFLSFGFQVGDDHWGVFSMHELAQTPQFLQAAI
ncbi:MAG: chemotaxis protein CheW [Gammaproteobacteria bacterium]